MVKSVLEVHFLNPPATRQSAQSGVIVFSSRTRTQRIELKFSLKLPTMPLHQVGLAHPDPIRIRTTPNWNLKTLLIQTNPLMIFKIYSARWIPNSMLTMYKSVGHCMIFRSTELAAKSDWIDCQGDLRWCSKFFRPDENRIRCCL